MALSIKHPEADSLARELADCTGESLTAAVINALRERLEKERAKKESRGALGQELLRIGKRCANLPVLDKRSPDEVLGYDDEGIPS